MSTKWKRVSPGAVRTAVCVVGIIAVLAVSACGELTSPTDPVGGPPPDPTATFTRVQNEIFTPTCAVVGCHGAIGTQQGLLLAQGSAYQSIVDVPSTEMPALRRIRPGDPANSYLFRKVTGAGITGDRMPLGGPPLSDANIDLIRSWIERGAPND